MKIAETYSHLNGLEFLLVHKPTLWQEIQSVIANVNANKCRTKVSKEKTMKGKLLYSPIDLNAAFKRLLREQSWDESRVSYWVTRSERLIRKTLTMSAEEQKREIEAAGETPMKSLQSHMSSGVAYYEGEFYNVVRQGRGVPAVPLVLIGIEP